MTENMYILIEKFYKLATNFSKKAANEELMKELDIPVTLFSERASTTELKNNLNKIDSEIEDARSMIDHEKANEIDKKLTQALEIRKEILTSLNDLKNQLALEQEKDATDDEVIDELQNSIDELRLEENKINKAINTLEEKKDDALLITQISLLKSQRRAIENLIGDISDVRQESINSNLEFLKDGLNDIEQEKSEIQSQLDEANESIANVSTPEELRALNASKSTLEERLRGLVSHEKEYLNKMEKLQDQANSSNPSALLRKRYLQANKDIIEQKKSAKEAAKEVIKLKQKEEEFKNKFKVFEDELKTLEENKETLSKRRDLFASGLQKLLTLKDQGAPEGKEEELNKKIENAKNVLQKAKKEFESKEKEFDKKERSLIELQESLGEEWEYIKNALIEAKNKRTRSLFQVQSLANYKKSLAELMPKKLSTDENGRPKLVDLKWEDLLDQNPDPKIKELFWKPFFKELMGDPNFNNYIIQKYPKIAKSVNLDQLINLSDDIDKRMLEITKAIHDNPSEELEQEKRILMRDKAAINKSLAQAKTKLGRWFMSNTRNSVNKWLNDSLAVDIGGMKLTGSRVGNKAIRPEHLKYLAEMASRAHLTGFIPGEKAFREGIKSRISAMDEDTVRKLQRNRYWQSALVNALHSLSNGLVFDRNFQLENRVDRLYHRMRQEERFYVNFWSKQEAQAEADKLKAKEEKRPEVSEQLKYLRQLQHMDLTDAEKNEISRQYKEQVASREAENMPKEEIDQEMAIWLKRTIEEITQSRIEAVRRDEPIEMPKPEPETTVHVEPEIESVEQLAEQEQEEPEQQIA